VTSSPDYKITVELMHGGTALQQRRQSYRIAWQEQRGAFHGRRS